jgi:hypothetical protein
VAMKLETKINPSSFELIFSDILSQRQRADINHCNHL